jgi:hypothetical protein
LQTSSTLRRSRIGLWLVLLLSAMLPNIARASTPGGPSLVPGNPATQIPRVADGPGIKLGPNSTFHGGAALSIGFDSNVFNEQRTITSFDGTETRGPRRAAYALPSVWLSMGNRPLRSGILDSPPKKTERKVDYHIGVLAGWRLYMDRRPAVWQASKLNLALDTRVVFAPGRKFSFAIEDDFNRLGEASNFQAGREENFNRIANSAALRFTIRPSGGRLSLDVAYRNELLYFQQAQFYRSNRLLNGIETETKYRFRDRSAFAVRYSFHYTYYFCCTEVGTGRNEDSQAHRVLGGYVGQLGKRVVLDVFAGYAALLYKQDVSGPNYKNFLGYLALGVFPTERTQLSLRIGRDVHDSLFGNYFHDTGGSFAAEHVFRWNMRLSSGLGVYARRYAGLPIPGEDTQDIVSYSNADGFVRKDTLVSFNLQLEQPLGRFAVIGARYSVASDITNFVATYANGFVDPAGFTRHLAMVFAAVRY